MLIQSNFNNKDTLKIHLFVKSASPSVNRILYWIVNRYTHAVASDTVTQLYLAKLSEVFEPRGGVFLLMQNKNG